MPNHLEQDLLQQAEMLLRRVRDLETRRPTVVIRPNRWLTDYSEDFYDIVAQHTMAMSTWTPIISNDFSLTLGRAATRLREAMYVEGFGSAGVAKEFTRFWQDVGAIPTQGKFTQLNFKKPGASSPYHSKMASNGWTGDDNIPNVSGDVTVFNTGSSVDGGSKVLVWTGLKGDVFWQYAGYADRVWVGDCNVGRRISLGSATGHCGLVTFTAPAGIYYADPDPNSTQDFWDDGQSGTWQDGAGNTGACYSSGYVSSLPTAGGDVLGAGIEVLLGVVSQACPNGYGVGCTGLRGKLIAQGTDVPYLAFPPIPNTGQAVQGTVQNDFGPPNAAGVPAATVLRQRILDCISYYPSVLAWFQSRLPLPQVTRERYNWKFIPIFSPWRGHLEGRRMGDTVFLRGSILLNGDNHQGSNSRFFRLPIGAPLPDFAGGFSIPIKCKLAYQGRSPGAAGASSDPSKGHHEPFVIDLANHRFTSPGDTTADQSVAYYGKISGYGPITIAGGPRALVFDGTNGYTCTPNSYVAAV